MKNKIVYLLFCILFLLTGCSCEYNLQIEGNTYKEKIILAGNTEETSLFKQKWQIPIDKEEYNNLSGNPGSSIDIENSIYNYKLSGNNLLFSYDFSVEGLNNSTAISNCYKTAAISDFGERITISTSSEVICFNKYPGLNNLIINIITDKPVVSHNADSKKGNEYTWKVTRENFSNKPINVILKNEDENDINNNDNQQNDININNNKDYTTYIFFGILLIAVFFGYFIVNTIKNKEDDIDD